MSAFLDTHAAVFLNDRRFDLFGAAGRRLLETSQLSLSPMVMLELDLLHQIGRISIPPRDIVQGLVADYQVQIASDRMAEVVEVALDLRWTRDPFDRLIVAHATLLHAPLLTRDRILAENYPRVVW